MSNRPDILMVAHRVPYPPDKGDRIRTYHSLRYLSRFASVHLACLADEPVSDATLDVLKSLCKRVAIAPLYSGRWLRGIGSMLRGRSITEGAFRSRQLVETLRGWAAETPFRGAIASSSGVAPYLWVGKLAKVPAVVDLVDVDSQKWFDYAAASNFPRSLLYRLEGRRLRTAERGIASWAEAVTLVSEAEASLFRQHAPRGHVCVATNGVDLQYFAPDLSPQAGEGCVFVGAMDYRPNVDAVTWFAHEIWPGVRERLPATSFRIVGRSPTKAVRKLATIPGIEVIGPVADVRPAVRESAVAVAPLRIARGLQNKVLEALAMGKPVVASAAALAGFRAEVPAVRATTPSEWIDHLTRLLEDDEERRRLGGVGRAFAERYHNWDGCLEPFHDLLGLKTREPRPSGKKPELVEAVL